MDPHYPLPGNMGIDYSQFAEDPKNTSEARKTLANAFLDTEPEEFRKQLLLSQFLDEKFKEEIKEASKVIRCYNVLSSKMKMLLIVKFKVFGYVFVMIS